MLDKDLISKYMSVIEFYKINLDELTDLVFAIIMADKLQGDNRLELDIDRLSASGLSCFNLQPKNVSPLPDVQVARLMCDSLYLYLSNKGVHIDGTHLTSQASNKVPISKSVYCNEYSDMEECERVLNAFASSCVPSEVDDLIKKYEGILLKYFEHLKVDGEVKEDLTPEFRRIKVPIESKLFTKADISEIPNYTDYFLDSIMISLEFYLLLRIRNSFGADSQQVMGNAKLMRMEKHLGGEYLFGTRSATNSVPRLEVAASLPSYAKPKVLRIYSVNKAYNIQDLEGVLKCLSYYLFKSKFSFEEEEEFLKGVLDSGNTI